MKYIVYITINSKNDKIYVGVHKTKTLDIFDGYIGCGCYVNQPSTYMHPKTAFQYAVKKYGVDSFRRITLYSYDTVEEALNKEAQIVDAAFIQNNNTYNIAIGGNLSTNHKPLYQFDTNGNLVKTWDISLDAYEFYGYDKSIFHRAISAKYLLLNYYWATTPTIDLSEYTIKQEHGNPITTYLYNKKGKLLKIFYSAKECAEFLDKKDINKAISAQSLINNSYYVSYKLVDEFKPKARINYMKKKFFVYKASGEFLGVYIGKQIMRVIDLHSWNKIRDILIYSKGWYKDYYISETEIEVLPSRNHSIAVEVFDEYGNYIETLNTIRELKDKYNVPSSKIKNIQKGNRYYKDYIFKYHSIHSK